MAETTATLPPDWSAFLADVQQRLQHAVASTDARLAALTVVHGGELAQARQREIARLDNCLHGLGAHLESAERLADEVDQVLLASEEALRQQATLSTSVRQRLAAWTGRAIG
jgi:hypothetical protein